MAVSVEFKKDVDSKNVRSVRIMLKDSMIIDPTFKEFDERIRYAETKLPDLYDDHDGENFSHDLSKWNKDYMNEQMVNLIHNFSKERIEFLKKLCRHIYADKVESIERERFVAEHQSRMTKEDWQKAGIGMSVGGAGVTVVAVCTSHPIIAAVGVATAVAGSAVYFSNK